LFSSCNYQKWPSKPSVLATALRTWAAAAKEEADVQRSRAEAAEDACDDCRKWAEAADATQEVANWAPVGEPRFLDFQISRYCILDILFLRSPQNTFIPNKEKELDPDARLDALTKLQEALPNNVGHCGWFDLDWLGLVGLTITHEVTPDVLEKKYFRILKVVWPTRLAGDECPLGSLRWQRLRGICSRSRRLWPWMEVVVMELQRVC
jgi:hypothetical protein